VSLGDLTGLKSILPRGMGWVRWTNEVLPRDISRTHLSDMWDPHAEVANEVLTRGTLSIFSDSVCVCLRSPISTQQCIYPQVAPR
jgi:hypothetical protein